jgi:hypothetical protein
VARGECSFLRQKHHKIRIGLVEGRKKLFIGVRKPS